MKAITKILICAIMLFSLLAVTQISSFCAEADSRDFVSEFSAIMPQESGASLSENELMSSLEIGNIIDGVSAAFSKKREQLVSFFLTVIGFAILCAVCEGASFLGSGEDKSLSAAVLTVMSVSVYPSIYSVLVSTRASLEQLSLFFGSALPIMSAINAASGAVKTAAVQAANMNIILGIIGAIATDLLLPLSFAILALALISSFGESGTLKTAKSIKRLFTFGLGIVTAASSAAISLQTVIASASDSAALRAARYAAGGLIPVVGSSVSSAISTLAGGLAYAKSTVGVGAIIAIACVVSFPLLSLLIHRLVFSVAESMLEYLDSSAASRCFSAYKTAFDTVISVYVMSTLVCIIEVIVFMKGGVSA
ncbi:MAG: hypothetical protein IKV16_02900 [Clostridia bacterium]|nr:hypothetical protein [Clostridia bacterium]